MGIKNSSYLAWLFLILICQQFCRVHSKYKNVVMMMTDDMRPEIRYFADSAMYNFQAYTPNLDELSRSSMVLKRAYVQQALCNPSRASLLTSRRPDTLHIYTLEEHFRDTANNVTTIPEYFKRHGYYTVGAGKVFHNVKGTPMNGQDPQSWSIPFDLEFNKDCYVERRFSHKAVNDADRTITEGDVTHRRPLQDENYVVQVKNILNQVAPAAKSGERPFFVAVGFHKPHIPFVFPSEFLQYYPIEQIPKPPATTAPSGLPSVAWYPPYLELDDYENLQGYELKHRFGLNDSAFPNELTAELRQAYYAAVSFVDSLVGAIVKHLKLLRLMEDTIVVFASDHGFSLGDHGAWAKHTNFEEALRSPLIIHIPGVTDHGVNITDVVELVDLFPTMVEAAGLPPLKPCPHQSTDERDCTEGTSMINLMRPTDDIQRQIKPFAFSQHIRRYEGEVIMGYSIRDKQYRYTEWVGFKPEPDFTPMWNRVYGRELYDYDADEFGQVNQANNPEFKEIRDGLKKRLRAGWRSATPGFDFDPSEFADLLENAESLNESDIVEGLGEGEALEIFTADDRDYDNEADFDEDRPKKIFLGSRQKSNADMYIAILIFSIVGICLMYFFSGKLRILAVIFRPSASRLPQVSNTLREICRLPVKLCQSLTNTALCEIVLNLCATTWETLDHFISSS